MGLSYFNILSNYDIPFVKISNYIQSIMISNPHNIFSKLFLPIISFFEGLIYNDVYYLDRRRTILGDNFCCAGQVVLGDFKTIEKDLTSPQERTFRLGSILLDDNHLPKNNNIGEHTFLLSISDKKFGGNHDVYRKCIDNYFFNTDAVKRQNDHVTKNLIDNLASDYINRLKTNNLNDFFNNTDGGGWVGFIIKYFHYVIFGINLNENIADLKTITKLFIEKQGFLYYLSGVNDIFKFFNIKEFRKVPTLIEKVASIYEKSPVLNHFKENDPKYNKITSKDLCEIMVTAISITILGPLTFGKIAMGYQKLPPYYGQKSHKIDILYHWDQLDLDNRSSILGFLLECSRLSPPVTSSYRVATNPFTIKINDKDTKFPKGTTILIPITLGNLSEKFWGKTVYEFNPQRKGLIDYHMGFNSVGNRHAGRMCPAKDIVLGMLTEVIITVGKERRKYLKIK
jgi:hypothetical protein